MALDHTYMYKISRTGVFQGLIPNVKSDFSYNQNLNNPGSQLVIEINTSPDTTSPIYGDAALLTEGNDLEVVLVNSTYPNGKTVFRGYVSKWTANYGGPETIQATFLSYGSQLDNIMIESGDTAYITQSTDNGSSWTAGTGGDKQPSTVVLQQFTMAVNHPVGGVSLEVSTAGGDASILSVQIRLQAGGSPNLNGDAIVMTGTLALAGGLSKSIQKVVFPGASTLTTGNTYYMVVGWQGTQFLTVWGNSTNPYANGTVWTDAFSSGTSWDAATQVSGSDLYFIVWQHGGSTVAAYTSVDPSFILSDILSFYNQGGGVIQAPTNPITPLLSLPISDGNVPSGFWGCAFAQTFTPTAGMTVNLVQLLLGSSSGSEFVTVQLVRGDPTLDTPATIGGSFSYTLGGSNTILATSNTRTIANTTPNITGFSFSSPITLVSGTQYYILVTFGQGSFSNLIFKGGTSSDSTIAPFGNMYYGLITFNNSSASMAFHSTTPVFYCNIGYQLPVPSNLDAGYGNTGVTASYTFKVNTVLEGVQKVLQLSPANWYWYVDIATNLLVFTTTGTTADHTMIKGRHINQLNLTRTSEQIENVVYFSGGDDGSGSNVFVKKTNPTSLASFPIGLAKVSDNRVHDTTAGGLLAQDALDRNAAPVYQTTLVIPNVVYDIDSFHLGQMIAFANFGNFIDTLLLQIVGIRYNPDMVTLTLGSQVPRSNQAVTDLERDLSLQQTIDNPTSPS